MKSIKIDKKVFFVDDTVYDLFIKLDREKENALQMLKIEEKAHLNCFNRCELYTKELNELKNENNLINHK